MSPLSEDKSEALFKRLLLASLLTYFLFALIIQIITYNPEAKRGPVKPLRVVKLIEVPLKGPASLSPPARKEMEKRLAEEQKRSRAEERRLEEERKRQTKERQAAEEQKRAEERQRQLEERKRQEEERRIAEERRRAEEEKRLAKERNREAAMRAGLLKAMKGGGKSLDKIVGNEEINSLPVITQKGKTQSAGRQEYTSTQKKILKGSGGIGDVSNTLAKAQPGGLSGRRGKADIQSGPLKGDAVQPPFGQGVPKKRSQESIKEVVTSHRGAIDFIYKKALRDNPTLKGTIVIELTIAANGDVEDGRIVSSTIKDTSFENQVLKRILSWKFLPYPDSGNTVVSFPIEFSPV